MVLKKVSKIYKIKNKDIYALNKINFEIDENKNGFYVIKGHSGSGKTTLIQVLGLLNDIDKGTYEIDGKKIDDLTEKEKADLRLKKFGFIFQDYHLMSHLKAYENIIVPMLINNMFLRKLIYKLNPIILYKS